MSNVGNQESKVLGIPFVLIGFIILNALAVLIPVIAMQNVVIAEVKKDTAPKIVKQVVVVTPTAIPTASPSAVKSTVVKPVVTNTLKTATNSGVRR